MDATRWQQVEEIFHAVADDAVGPERDKRLLTLCRGDEQLAADVSALLVEDARQGTAGDGVDPHVGLRLGNYLVEGLIARGGMAGVYRAWRADDTFRQRVAIKIMDVRLSDPALVTQFMAERQILAALEHPALTRLLDGGVTPLGEPYLVMEHVEGQPIDAYCDARRLSLPDRIRLFREVCAGVAFAHRNLVLHRDLKPSNILVSSDGRLKIVDFGTAALLAPDQLTTLSRAPMTPAYASPEQLTGQAVGTTSDQYSLGLVLYRLVTGATPFAERTSFIAAVERAIAGESLAPPETVVDETVAAARRVSLVRLRRHLSGDLGAIVRRAAAAEPAARYASVEHLSEDLERWMRGDAVSARPPSFSYLASRVVARHRVSLAVAAVLLLSLVGATVVSLRQAAVARTESAKARQLNRFLTGMLSSANPSWVNAAAAANAGTITVRQVLDGAGAIVATELGSAPEVEAEMRRTLGRTYIGLGAVDQARPHLERALELYRAAADAHGVAFTQNLLGNIQMQKGDFKGAEVLLRQAVAYVRSSGAAIDPELHQIALSDLASAIAYQRPGHEEALLLMRESAATRPGSNRVLASITYANLAGQYVRLGKLDDAEAAVRDALTLMASQSTPPPEHYSTLRTVGVIHLQKGEFVEAERVLREAAEGAARTRPATHPLQPNFKIWWARALLALGDVERARPVVLDAFAGYTRLRPAGHLEMALPLITVGVLHRADGQLVASERAIREAREILQRNPGSKDRAADAAGELGLTLRAMGRNAEAESLLEESHQILRAAFGDAHPLTRQAQARLTRPGRLP